MNTIKPRSDKAAAIISFIATVILLTWPAGGAWTQGAANRDTPQTYRAHLLSLDLKNPAATTELRNALTATDPVVARTAARLLGTVSPVPVEALKAALAHEDVQVRRIAAMGLVGSGPQVLPLLEAALADPQPMVRQAAVISIASLRPRSPEALALITKAGSDEDGRVLESAVFASRSYFVPLLRIQLPNEGWKFMTDPNRVGEEQRWFAVDFDDSGWHDIGISGPWQNYGHDYVGWGWYRLEIQLPPKPEGAERAELQFGAVDESAWVWCNGTFVGYHDIGSTGWDKPFSVGLGDSVRWGETNQITVRAMNTAFAGGIWQPVVLVAMSLDE